MKRVVGVTIFLIVVVTGALVYVVRGAVPDQHDPWAPLSIDRPHGLATNAKLRRLGSDADACFEVLEASDLEYQPIEDRTTGEGCGFFDAGRLLRSNVSWGGNVTLTCPALVALARWERHDLQPLAREIFGEELVRIRHYGTYACRNVNGRSAGRRSEHATANAIDVAAFVLAGGQEIAVDADWDADTDAGRFLVLAHRRACGLFRTVLGPDYNAAHHNHFHLDMGGWSICR